jgi:hypothetical protein
MTAADPCVFVFKSSAFIIHVVLHVDDTFLSSSSLEGIAHFKTIVSSKFPITSNDHSDQYLGVHMRSNANGSVTLLQTPLISKLVKNLADKLPTAYCATPTPSSMVSHPQDAELINVKDFSALIGSMSYVTHSIPIVATALSYSGARQSRPLHRDYRYLLHTLGYLRDHADEGLTLMTVAHGGPAGRRESDRGEGAGSEGRVASGS